MSVCCSFVKFIVAADQTQNDFQFWVSVSIPRAQNQDYPVLSEVKGKRPKRPIAKFSRVSEPKMSKPKKCQSQNESFAGLIADIFSMFDFFIH